MSLLTLTITCSNETFNNVITFNYDNIILDFGLEATANLLNAFNTQLLESFKEHLDEKYLLDAHASIVEDNITIITINKDFQDLIKDFVDSFNQNESNIISQIKHYDLLLEDEQKDFLKRIISYELLHILLKMETERLKDNGNDDKKISKI